jgi:hypothetical protein
MVHFCQGLGKEGDPEHSLLDERFHLLFGNRSDVVKIRLTLALQRNAMAKSENRE